MANGQSGFKEALVKQMIAENELGDCLTYVRHRTDGARLQGHY